MVRMTPSHWKDEHTSWHHYGWRPGETVRLTTRWSTLEAVTNAECATNDEVISAWTPAFINASVNDAVRAGIVFA